MALEVNELRGEGTTADVFVSAERLMLTEDGEVCAADDERARSLLVPAGGSMPMARAIELGIAGEPPADEADEPPADEADEPPAKRRRGTSDKARRGKSKG